MPISSLRIDPLPTHGVVGLLNEALHALGQGDTEGPGAGMTAACACGVGGVLPDMLGFRSGSSASQDVAGLRPDGRAGV